MPLSLRSSSFCFLACLCSSVWAYAQQSINNNITPPYVVDGETIKLKTNCFIEDIYGTKFPASFIGSDAGFSILGKNRSLVFDHCQAPASSYATLISATSNLKITNLNKLVLNENVSLGSHGLIYAPNICIMSCKSLICSGNKTPYSPVVVTQSGGEGRVGGTTTINASSGSTIQISPYAPPPKVSETVLEKSALLAEAEEPVPPSLRIEKIKKEITFCNNSANFGSAILSTTDGKVNIQNNSAPISFLRNFGACSGGAIYNGDITFANNSGYMKFSGNAAANGLGATSPNPTVVVAGGCGGAICSPTKSVTFRDNTGACLFHCNLSEKDAGAIYATTCNITTQAPMIFDNNNAKGNGGAICAKSLTLSSSGDMLFMSNRAKQGGAIYVDPSVGANGGSPTCALTINAKHGDIIFSSNNLDCAPGLRNAVYADSTATIALGADSGARIIFYDPLTHVKPAQRAYALPSHPQPESTAIASAAAPLAVQPRTNPAVIKVNDGGQGGSVVFSGKLLTLSEKIETQNFTSSLYGNVNINGGQLVVTNDAILNVLGITQSNGGILTVGSGAQVGQIPGVSDVTTQPFTITNLGCDVTSFLNPNWTTANINSGTSTATTVNNLNIVYDDASYLYDNPMLMHNLCIPVVTLGGSGSSQLSSFTEGNINEAAHYGYQGTWSRHKTTPLLAPTPSGGVPQGVANKTIYALWTPSTPLGAEYILDPSRKGEIVVNSLWASFLASQAFSEALNDSLISDYNGVFLSGKSIGAHIFQNQKDSHEGFKGRYGGYQASLSVRYPDDACLGVAFGQLYGQIKNVPYNAKDTKQMILSSFFGQLPIVTKKSETNVTWKTAYTYVRNHMKTQYPSMKSKLSKSSAHWHENIYYGLLSVEHPYIHWCTATRYIAKKFELTGFLAAEMVGGWQQAFIETGALARKFSRGYGHNLALPIGFYSQWYSPFAKAPSTVTLKLAYKPDIYRVDPHNDMTIVANQESFATHGTSISRHGIYLELNDSIELQKHVTAFIDYVLDARKGYTSHRLSTGLQGRF
ncbi:autotransporter beta-domain protein [Chlamydia ibidis]|uniref:Autotransporter beta-domain protein n=2 Tax=Chlamydia ibidis TaxID=1405396 RepID=S7KGV5_9CHLA|nr:polymorphic outer membrane protein middle domain-containing protein [Chlamydia ibidis]EPP35401.1 autotransporter beta-domain protein [Chlamydia ibidis]EQM62866.1 autotransporter beta-domain protein [Chlamydia ibidis 10-1398/6]